MEAKPIVGLVGSAILGWMQMASAAEDEPRTPILLLTSADGIYSRQFIYHLREALRASQGMSLSSDEQALHQLRIVAIDDGHNGLAYSVAWTYVNGKLLPSLVRHTVGLCGSDVIRSCADSVVAATDQQLSDESDAWSEALKGMDLSEFKKQQQTPTPAQGE